MRGVRMAVAALAVALLAQQAPAMDKAVWHYISLPLVDGAGIYAGVASLVDKDASLNTDIAAGTTLGLLAAQGTLGMITAFAGEEHRPALRKVHRIMGFVVTAAGLWLGVANSVDGADWPQQAGAYGFTALSTVPLIMFRF